MPLKYIDKKVRGKDLDSGNPSHYDAFQALMCKAKVTNSNASKEFKTWLIQQIHTLSGHDLTGRTEDILMVDNYYIQLKKYILAFQEFCEVYANSFEVGFKHSV